MAKRFVIPFATSGDKSVTPDATDPAGAISYSQGWGAQYQLPNTDPSYRPVGRQEMNGVLNDITGAIAEVQTLGFPEWVAVGGLVVPYRVNAVVRHNDFVWQSVVANNSEEPGTGSQWLNNSTILNQAVGRLLRTSIYTLIGGVQMVSVNGAAFTPTGAGNWTALSTTSAIAYQLQGAGAAGAGCAAATAGQISIAGGGGAGTFAQGFLTSGFSGTHAVTVGAGGIGAAAGSGTAGGATSLGSILTCPGGQISAAGSTVTPGTTPFIAGGTAQSTAPTGTLLWAVRGGEGMYGAFFSSNGFVSGHGGASYFGPGAAPVSFYSNGNPALNYGAGGSGSLTTGGNGSSIGGNGMPGIEIIREYS